MPDATEIKILLRTIADLTGLTQTRQAIAGTTAEFEAASAATGEFSAILGGLAGGAAAFGITAIVGALLQIPSLIHEAAEEGRQFNEELDRSSRSADDQIAKWGEMAKAATNFKDIVALATAGVSELKKLQGELEKAQSRDGNWVTNLIDFAAKKYQSVGSQLTGGVLFDPDAPGPYGGGRQNRVDKAEGALDKGVNALTQAEQEALQSAKDLNEALAGPPTEGLTKYTTLLEQAQAKFTALQPGDSLADQEALRAQGAEVARLTGVVEKFRSLTAKAGTESKDFALSQRQAAIDQARLAGENVDAAQHQLSVEQKIVQLTKAKSDALRDGTVTRAQINTLAEREVTNEEKLKAAHAGSRGEAMGLRLEHQQISALLTEENQKLQRIRGDMQAIESNPFLTINDKNAAAAQLIPKAIDQLNRGIQTNKATLANSALDPVQWQRVQGAIAGSEREIAKYKIQLQLANSPTKQLQAGLVSWANQFGTTAKQIGNTITSTIGTAVNGVSNAITGAIFKTQSWGQAFAQVAQQIVANIIQIVVQWVAQQAVMLALQAVFGQAAAATTATAASESAAAWAPAATAASIATEGEAAVIGTGALATAMGVGQGILTGFSAGGFDRGGFTGGQEGRFAGIVHGEEFVFSAPAVRRAGLGNLENLHVKLTRPSYEAGGFVGPSRGSSSGGGHSAPQINQALFYDIRQARKWLFDQTGKKEIRDITHGPRRTVHR